MIAKITVIISAYFLLPLASMPVSASEIYIYPSQGQSEDQMGQDKYECHNWASKQTGYDPTKVSSSPVGASNVPPNLNNAEYYEGRLEARRLVL